jgi:anti-repressor protein
MSELDVFHHGAWELRTLLLDGDPWFVAADVCGALGLENTTKALLGVDDDALNTAEVIDRLGRRQTARIVSEAGLYELIFQSRRPEARQFRRWVTGEVLPSIRRTGRYGVEAACPPAMPTHSEALRGWADALERAEVAEQQVAVLAPAARFADQLAEAAGDYSVREAAQILDRDPNINTGERRLFGTLRALAWIDARNEPYQGQVNCGRLVRRLGSYRDDRTGELVTYAQVRVTPKGLRELHRRLGGTSSLTLIDRPAVAR